MNPTTYDRPFAGRSSRPRHELTDGLTGAQREFVLLLVSHLVSHGRPPTYRWLMERTGILSPNGIRCHYDALVRKGVIERDFMASAGVRLCGLRLRLDCDDSPAGRRLRRLLGPQAPQDAFEQGGGI